MCCATWFSAIVFRIWWGEKGDYMEGAVSANAITAYISSSRAICKARIGAVGCSSCCRFRSNSFPWSLELCFSCVFLGYSYIGGPYFLLPDCHRIPVCHSVPRIPAYFRVRLRVLSPAFCLYASSISCEFARFSSGSYVSSKSSYPAQWQRRRSLPFLSSL